VILKCARKEITKFRSEMYPFVPSFKHLRLRNYRKFISAILGDDAISGNEWVLEIAEIIFVMY